MIDGNLKPCPFIRELLTYFTVFGILLLVGIIVFIIVSTVGFGIFIRGEITGTFIEGYHEGYGDFCGDYPNSGIRLRNESYNQDHFYHGDWFYFGNQYKGIDKMIEGQEYKISYHQESRQSDVSASTSIDYWVIDNVEGR